MKALISIWKTELKNRSFLLSLVAIIVLLAILFTFISYFQSQIELRSGVVFNDPILDLFPAIQLDWVTFIALYSAHLLAIIIAFKQPKLFLQLAWGYFFVYFFRVISIYLIPLEPPADMILLKDPFLYWFGGGDITKDLFYSGHTASLFVAFLTMTNKKVKVFLFIALVVVMAGVILQKVHYTIDVYAALFFAYCSYRIAKRIMN